MEAILPDIGKALIGLGPGGILAFIFWRDREAERAERRVAQAEAIAMGREAIKANIEGANVIEALTKRIEDWMRVPK